MNIESNQPRIDDGGLQPNTMSKIGNFATLLKSRIGFEDDNPPKTETERRLRGTKFVAGITLGATVLFGVYKVHEWTDNSFDSESLDKIGMCAAEELSIPRDEAIVVNEVDGRIGVTFRDNEVKSLVEYTTIKDCAEEIRNENAESED